MIEEPFVDYYEVLQVSPNADTETIDRVFRHLARRYHPDNTETSDRELFDRVVLAHRVLTDPQQRAAYDVQYQQQAAVRWQLTQEAAKPDSFEFDHLLRVRVLSLLYIQRRREPSKPGLGNMDLSRILACPFEHMEFHLWYLRQKGWIELTENGHLAITASGVDRVEGDRLLVQRRDRLLTEHGSETVPPEPAKQIEDPDRGRPAR